MILSINFDKLLTDAGAWSMHVGRISFWVLLAVSFLLLLIRSLLMRLFAERFNLAAIRVTKKRLHILLFGSIVGLALATFFLIKPDSNFLIYLAEQALDRQDYEEAASYYEPLASWGTDRVDVYNNLAVSYFNLGRFTEAIDNFHQVQRLAPKLSVQSYIFCARAHRELGQSSLAISQWQQALALSQSVEQQQMIRAQLAELYRQNPNISQ